MIDKLSTLFLLELAESFVDPMENLTAGRMLTLPVPGKLASSCRSRNANVEAG
jgi:hypothetical protein